MTNVIDCQRCSPEDSGCATCGGYKYVLAQHACPRCGHKRWSRPGCFTVYEGKTYYSVDGVKVTYTGLDAEASICSFCPQSEPETSEKRGSTDGS